MRGRKQALLTAVLSGNFRPDRQGPLLLEEVLPAVLPVEGNDRAHEAWSALVAAQHRCRVSGAVDPWGFAGLIRTLHAALRDGRLSAGDRGRIVWALTRGPWRVLGPGGLPVGRPEFADEELAAHWREWAHFEPASHLEPDWNERTYAFHRFVEGLEPQEAFRAARGARRVARA